MSTRGASSAGYIGSRGEQEGLSGGLARERFYMPKSQEALEYWLSTGGEFEVLGEGAFGHVYRQGQLGKGPPSI